MKFDKKTFKNLFLSQTAVKLTDIYGVLNVNNDESLLERLGSWKLSSYFDIKKPFLMRNATPSAWDKLKPKLKKAGKWALSKSVPVAIGIATGGAGLGVAMAPILKDIIGKFKSKGLDVSEDSQNSIVNTVQGTTDKGIEILVKKLQRDNKHKGISPEILLNKIKLCINEDLFPFIAEIQEVLKHLKGQQEHLTEIFEEWMVEQAYELKQIQSNQHKMQVQQENGLYLTLDALNQLEEAFSPYLQSIQEGVLLNNNEIKQANTTLIQIEDSLKIMFNNLCKSSLVDLPLDELFQLAKIQFQNVHLAGKFDKPYDPMLFIPTDSLEWGFTEFLKDSGATPLYLLLANMGMGKTWNAAHLGFETLKTQLAIPFFIPIYQNYETILSNIFGIRGSGLASEIGQKCTKIYHKTNKKILLIFDGLDEYPSQNRQPFLTFLEQLVRGYSESIQIILTGRITDWCQNDQINSFYRVVTSHIYPNMELEAVRNQFNIATPLSGYLSEFDDD